jgi:hypothetical protein
VPALLVALLLAAPVAAESWPPVDGATATHEGAVQNVAQPAKLTDHATRRPHRSASVEEFVGIDDDAEQYLTSLPVLLTPSVLPASAAEPVALLYSSAPRTHRACAAFPTGPPHA